LPLESSDFLTIVDIMRNVLASFIFFTATLYAQEAHIVVEAYSGKVLSASGATTKRSVASLTKIATAIVAVDWATATQSDLGAITISIPESASLIGDSTSLGLRIGDTMTIRDALYASLLSSDNYAAHAIAHHIGTDILARRGKAGAPVQTFVAEMNILAKAVLAKNTRFTNPHGIDLEPKPGYSTAADMARFSIHAMRRNPITFITRQESREIKINGIAKTINNTNELTGETGILGIKTGTTQKAGACLATCMDRDPLVVTKVDGNKGVTPRRLIVVVLNSQQDRFTRSRKLMRDGWAYYDAWIAAGAPVKDAKHEILATPPPAK
jgi:D-alanyl-D-alanine carboxypeptidase (penicillin-binding protein 5/6)